MRKDLTINGKRVSMAGSNDAKKILLWPVMPQQITGAESYFDRLCKLTGFSDFMLVLLEIAKWNDELSPWAFTDGKNHFGGNGNELIKFILNECIPSLCTCLNKTREEMIFGIGGYSLAGLFSMWAACNTKIFAGAASCSGSLWYPGFVFGDGKVLPFAQQDMDTGMKSVYLSLGDKEAKIRHPLMKRVEEATRAFYDILSEKPQIEHAVLVMNPGNHFKEPEERMLKGFGWLLNQLQ